MGISSMTKESALSACLHLWLHHVYTCVYIYVYTMFTPTFTPCLHLCLHHVNTYVYHYVYTMFTPTFTPMFTPMFTGSTTFTYSTPTYQTAPYLDIHLPMTFTY